MRKSDRPREHETVRRDVAVVVAGGTQRTAGLRRLARACLRRCASTSQSRRRGGGPRLRCFPTNPEVGITTVAKRTQAAPLGQDRLLGWAPPSPAERRPSWSPPQHSLQASWHPSSERARSRLACTVSSGYPATTPPGIGLKRPLSSWGARGASSLGWTRLGLKQATSRGLRYLEEAQEEQTRLCRAV